MPVTRGYAVAKYPALHSPGYRCIHSCGSVGVLISTRSTQTANHLFYSRECDEPVAEWCNFSVRVRVKVRARVRVRVTVIWCLLVYSCTVCAHGSYVWNVVTWHEECCMIVFVEDDAYSRGCFGPIVGPPYANVLLLSLPL